MIMRSKVKVDRLFNGPKNFKYGIKYFDIFHTKAVKDQLNKKSFRRLSDKECSEVSWRQKSWACQFSTNMQLKCFLFENVTSSCLLIADAIKGVSPGGFP